MKNLYYKQIFYLPEVNNKDIILGKIERWKAHKEGILHRGFTVILTYENKYILQKRKHIAFDNLYDLSFSSHSRYVNNLLIDDQTAIKETFEREWKKVIYNYNPKFLGTVYYKSKDKKSIFTEHEIDHIYKTELKELPVFHPDFSYGYELLSKNEILKTNNNLFTPWTEKILKKYV